MSRFEKDITNRYIEFTKKIEEEKKQAVKAREVADIKREQAEEDIGYICHTLKGEIPMTICLQDKVLSDTTLDRNTRIAAVQVKADISLLEDRMSRQSISYRPVPQDLLDDLKSPQDSPSSKYLDAIVFDAIKRIIPNICNKIYDENAYYNYFGDNENMSKKVWDELAGVGNRRKRLIEIINQYLFKFNCNVDESCSTLLIGNIHNSAINFRVFFEEIYHNAVKYVSYLPYDKRYVMLNVGIKDEGIALSLENTYVTNQKSSRQYGGSSCLERLAKGFGAQRLEDSEHNDIFNVSYIIPIK